MKALLLCLLMGCWTGPEPVAVTTVVRLPCLTWRPPQRPRLEDWANIQSWGHLNTLLIEYVYLLEQWNEWAWKACKISATRQLAPL